MIDISQIVRNILSDLGLVEVSGGVAQCESRVGTDLLRNSQVTPKPPAISQIIEPVGTTKPVGVKYELVSQKENSVNSGNSVNSVSAEKIDTVELRLSCRLVTFAEIRDKLKGIRKIVVPKRSIITPLVRDELRAKKIVIEESG